MTSPEEKAAERYPDSEWSHPMTNAVFRDAWASGYRAAIEDAARVATERAETSMSVTDSSWATGEPMTPGERVAAGFSANLIAAAIRSLIDEEE